MVRLTSGEMSRRELRNHSHGVGAFVNNLVTRNNHQNYSRYLIKTGWVSMHKSAKTHGIGIVLRGAKSPAAAI